MKNTAVIGAGRWGMNHIRTFHKLGVLKAVVEVVPAVQEKVKSNFPDVEIYSTLNDVLENNEITAVSIATPAETHYTVARMLIEAGKNVLVEKPLALYSKHAEDLVKLAEKKKVVLMVGHLLLYHSAIENIKKMIEDGTLGDLQYLYSNRVNLGTIRKEENVLWSFAPHDISILNYLVGSEPVDVKAEGAVYLQPNIHDVTVTHLRYPHNVNAHVHVSWLHPFKEQRLVVIGDKGMIVFEDARQDNKLIFYPKGIDWIEGRPVTREGDFKVITLDEELPLTKQCRAFVDCAQNGTKPINDGMNGLSVLRVLEKAQESLTGEKVVQPKISAPAKPFYVDPTAIVDEPCEIGEGTKIWHFSHVMKGVKIGKKCIFGQNCHIADNVIIGNNVKVQNNVSIYTGTVIEDDVFLGPSCVLTNVTNPRSQVNRHSLYEMTLLKRGCSVGANATIVCGTTIGRYSFIAAGAVVPKDVPDYAMMMGVPAKKVGWVSRHGLPLRNPDSEGIYTCPESGFRYKEVEPDILRCLDLDEEAPLPANLAIGNTLYDDIVHKKD